MRLPLCAPRRAVGPFVPVAAPLMLAHTLSRLQHLEKLVPDAIENFVDKMIPQDMQRKMNRHVRRAGRERRLSGARGDTVPPRTAEGGPACSKAWHERLANPQPVPA